MTTNEPRALSAALANPVFATRGGGMAMHAADRHVERWAPETAAGTNRSRPLRSLGFVDRLISPWVEAAQRSASLRLFNQYSTQGMPENQGKDVSWVFPRPWYQDELDWMAAARRAPLEQSAGMFTTRGTFVAPAVAPPRPQQHAQPERAHAGLPPALYEYVAPSLSIAQPTATPGVGYGGDAAFQRSIPGRANEAFSTIVPLAAVQAADVMARTVSRLPATVAAAPALRSVLSTLLERTATQSLEPDGLRPSRIAMNAPELVTPPAPREDAMPLRSAQPAQQATSVADHYAQQHLQIAELQRVARQSAERREQSEQIERQASAGSAITPEAPARAENREQQVRVVEETRRTQADAQQQIEERVARRIAERSTQRLHEQARTDAATHARAAVEQATRASQAASSTTSLSSSTPTQQPAPIVAPTRPYEAPPEVANAIASLPPELAAMLSRRPDRAAQTISELDHAYRTVELLARNSAAGGSFEVTRGPRLMMPAGLGGLVAAVEQAPTRAVPAQPTGSQTMQSVQLQAMQAARAEAARVRTPALPWLHAPSSLFSRQESHVSGRHESQTRGPTSALGAAAAAVPAALSHVAWSDRWLARFAGASTQSLETLSIATQDDARTDLMPRVRGLAAGAPGAVYVSPSFDAVRDAETVRFDARGHAVMTASTPSSIAPMFAPVAQAPVVSSSVAASPEATRFDDADETPDDVFAAISASAASQRRGSAHPAQPVTSIAAPIAARPPMTLIADVDRPSVADTIAHAAPQAPNAGLAAQLAASPFAPALRHILSIPSATSFDVRALFGGALSTSYLAGLLAPESHEIEVAPRTMPSWARFSDAPSELAGDRSVPSWDAAYVSPDAPAQGAQDEAIAAYIAQAGATPTSAAMPAVAAMSAASAADAFTTVRSALLSWEGEITPAGTSSSSVATATGELRARAIGAGTARELIDAMSLPMLGDVEPPASRGESWAAPGMVAERAHGWSVAQERSSADLSFDFVPPELVLAARVYGLGPAEAAQAARLAIVGPGQLSAMAGTVDRTFVQAMAFEADRRERSRTQAQPVATPAIPTIPTTAYPTPAGEVVLAGRSDLIGPSAPAPASSTFGVERRAPRGAFLWPQATVAALKLDAPGPDSRQAMSIAALELLAAQTVAELGTYAALGEPMIDASGAAEMQSVQMQSVQMQSGLQSVQLQSGIEMSEMSAATPAMPMVGGEAARGPSEIVEPSEQDVLQAAVALVPESRRPRFDALYLALGRSPSGVTVSPAARAARALALAGRGEDGPVSAHDRAASAWDVLPVVYAVELGEAAASMAYEASGGAALTGGARARAAARANVGSMVGPSASGSSSSAPGTSSYLNPDLGFIDVRPGLAGLSARAGEALGSFVAPSGAAGFTSAPASSSSSSSSSSADRDREMGAMLRVPTAAQEMVQTGRPSGRFGGGEVEIPTWFEAAARKMFESQSGSMGEGISMAELTLISSTPSNQIAASSRGTPGASTPVSSGAAGNAEPKPGQKVDIEKIANEIYRQILAMMDMARARNGEPYL